MKNQFFSRFSGLNEKNRFILLRRNWPQGWGIKLETNKAPISSLTVLDGYLRHWWRSLKMKFWWPAILGWDHQTERPERKSLGEALPVQRKPLMMITPSSRILEGGIFEKNMEDKDVNIALVIVSFFYIVAEVV